MKVVLTGASGMLGSAFKQALVDNVTLIGRVDLDVTRPGHIDALVRAAQADVLINCAAHVDAEAAESDLDPVVAANILLPSILATACRRAGTTMVHFSSTGCYGAWKTTPYTEEDEVRPTTAHHRTKVAGEAALRAAGCEHLILRTGWLFGGGPQHKKNFVWKRLQEAAANPVMASDTAQFGCPTHIDDVVMQTLTVLEKGVRGTFNCVAGGSASRFDYVSRIVAASGLDCTLRPSGAFVRAAPVSPNETAVNYRLGLMRLDRMPHWTQSLDQYVTKLQAAPEWRALTNL